jgi:hypothetical protein
MHVKTGSHRCFPYLGLSGPPQGSPPAGGRCEKAENATSPIAYLFPGERDSSVPELSPDMEGRCTRNLIRALTGLALCTALAACAAAPVPQNLPAIACQQAGLYRLEIALLIFYSQLLLITPAFSGLVRGRLPTEISVRGARFVEESDQAENLNEEAIEEMEAIINRFATELGNAEREVQSLKERVGDST